MPLAAGVVEGDAAVPTIRALEQAIGAKGHVDTGLTGTYFMCGGSRVFVEHHLHNDTYAGQNC